ncbi:permease [Sinomonas atrocyanea]
MSQPEPDPDSLALPTGRAPEPPPEQVRRAEAIARTAVFLVLAAVVLVPVLIFRAFVPSATAGIEGAAQDFFTLAVSVVIESVPFVFLGILISILVQVWLPQDLLLRRLPARPGLRRLTLSFLGILMPVCECGNVPLARGLVSSGLTVAEAMTFLFAAPILNPITIVTTGQAFGWDSPVLAARVAGGFLIANLVGWIYARHPRPEQLLTPGFQASCAADGHGHGHGQGSRLRRSLELFAHETNAMMPALIVGAALAGIIQVFVSRDALVALGGDVIWSVLALMALAFIVALCSNVDAFFILSFGSTFLPGAIASFLVFGPMIDVKMIALLRTTFTAKTLAALTLLIGACAAVLGWAVNLAA